MSSFYIKLTDVKMYVHNNKNEKDFKKLGWRKNLY